MAKEKCDKNCMTCSIDNRMYCAVQMSIATQEILMKLAETVDVNSVAIQNMQSKLSPLFGQEGVVPIQPSIAGEEAEE